MKALVTGASGFVGSTLVEELTASGIEVYALMRKTSKPYNLKNLKFEKVEGQLSDLDSLRRAVKGMDYIFHVAGVIQARNRERFFENNSEGTRRLAQAAAEENPGLTRFVYVSSLAAGGPCSSSTPRVETQADAPVSAYGESKLQGEKELLKYKDQLPISIVRPPIVYGPKDRAIFTMAKTVARNLMPLPPSGTPDGHKYYSSIHVKDLCRGIIQCALPSRSQLPSGEVFYLAADAVHTYEDLMTAMAKGLGRNPIRLRIPKFAIKAAAAGFSVMSKITGKTFPLNLDKLNELLPDYWICSNEKAKSLIGFKPEFDLARGMSNTMEWYQREGWI